MDDYNDRFIPPSKILLYSSYIDKDISSINFNIVCFDILCEKNKLIELIWTKICILFANALSAYFRLKL